MNEDCPIMDVTIILVNAIIKDEKQIVIKKRQMAGHVHFEVPV
jgi:hypothetical protein